MDGLKPLGNVRGQINTVQSFTSSSNVARVYFHSDDSGTRDGFRASYAAGIQTALVFLQSKLQ